MKLLLNKTWGGITPETAMLRRDEELIGLVERGEYKGRKDRFGNREELTVVTIPDNATDYCVVNYDGVEGVFYCVGGHISFVPASEDCRIFDEVSGFVQKKDI